MTDQPYHQSVRLVNFTAFQTAEFDFVPGVNVFVGENGTGKTHVMKALYAMQLSLSRQRDIDTSLKALFQLGDAAHIVRSDTVVDDYLSASGQYLPARLL